MTIYKMLAIYTLCADYHSGQGSRGYRLLSKIGKRLRQAGITHPLDFISIDQLAVSIVCLDLIHDEYNRLESNKTLIESL